jgi:D-alanyl-lipoteichoic acid acyltransferase DltB (MBOAT superfamily)
MGEPLTGDAAPPWLTRIHVASQPVKTLFRKWIMQCFSGRMRPGCGRPGDCERSKSLPDIDPRTRARRAAPASALREKTMLFNSYGFIFFFLPVALLGFFTLARLDHTIAAAWLAVASLFFYGWWNPAFVVLLLASIAFNYSLGAYITKTGSGENTTLRRCAFVLAISVNLLVLAYYKYALFLLSMLTGLTGRQIPLGEIVLPLGISFFTFTQIAFLVDAYRGEAKEYSLVHYALFVSYFPHLIAGPILHHKEMMPQFAKATT